MKTFYQKKFLKDSAKIPANYRNQIEKFVFEETSRFKIIGESKKFEKMIGYPSYFKIRFGVYRAGLK